MGYCLWASSYPPSGTELGRSSETQPVKDLGKEALINAVDTLPTSPLQQAVSASMHRYYSNPQPASITYGDLSFQISSAVVNIGKDFTRDKEGIDGDFNYRKNTPTTMVLSAINPGNYLVPLDDLILPGELNQMPKQLQRQNSFVFPFEFPVEGKFVESIQPEITLTFHESSNKFFTQKEKQDLERMTLIKEACSLALEDILVRRIVDKMHAMNLPTRIDAVTATGEKVSASPLVDAMALMSTNRGRFTASLDLGGYFLMFKLVEGTDMEKTLLKLPDFPEAIKSAKRFDLPADLNELFATSVRWAKSGPEPLKLAHVGDITLIP